MDKTTKTQVAILLLGVLIGASGYLANSLYLWNTSLSKDRSDVAMGIYLDVSSAEDYLVSLDRDFLANMDEKYVFVQATPLYPDNGMYFASQRDITKLDRNLARDTFTFYNHLLSAERDRALIYEIQRGGDMRELTAAELRRQQLLTRHAARQLNLSVSMLPALKQDLNAAR